MKNARIRSQYQYTYREEVPKDALRRQVMGGVLNELLEHFADDIRVKELDSSIQYNQLETELWVFTPKMLSEFVEQMALPEERYKMQHRLHQSMEGQSKIKFK